MTWRRHLASTLPWRLATRPLSRFSPRDREIQVENTTSTSAML
jgi:hypothetical protein